MSVATQPDTVLSMGVLRWKLPAYLKARGITAYRLAATLDDYTRSATIYRLARERTEVVRIDLDVVARILDGLRAITKEEVALHDILEYEPD